MEVRDGKKFALRSRPGAPPDRAPSARPAGSEARRCAREPSREGGRRDPEPVFRNLPHRGSPDRVAGRHHLAPDEQPDPAVDACYVNVRYAQANDDGAGNILAYVKITIDGRLVAKISAFFESFVYFDYTMVHGTGFRVPCGLSGASGSADPAIGKIYTLDVKAYDITNNWVLDDQMPVGCPAFIP